MKNRFKMEFAARVLAIANRRQDLDMKLMFEPKQSLGCECEEVFALWSYGADAGELLWGVRGEA